tara:strand:+ start:1022 stop:1492 length:471 start_codon:yes stop_codon:yes gene_type:complete
MADTKVSNLTELTTADSTDVLYIVDTSDSKSKKITFNNLLKNNAGITFPSVVTTVTSLSTDFVSISTAVEQVTAFQTASVASLSTDLLILSSNHNSLSSDVDGLSAYEGRKDIFLSLSAQATRGGNGTAASPLTVNVTDGSTTTLTFISGMLVGTT